MQLQKSHQTNQTKNLIALLSVLGVSDSQIHFRLLNLRAKFLRHQVETGSITYRAVIPLLKPLFDQILLIHMELGRLRIDCEEWLYDRYAEIRKLVKTACRHSDSQHWLDKVTTID